MKNFALLTIVFIAIVLLFTSCKKDDPEPELPQELITTLIMTFNPVGGGPAVEFIFRDLDGDGGDPPVITTASLAANTMYRATTELLDETEDPPHDVTHEIEEEDDEHQFFFRVTGVQLTHAYVDFDGDGYPVGLINDFATHAPGVGSLTVTLRHEPDKSAQGVADGDITLAGGDTDIEVDFPLIVE